MKKLFLAIAVLIFSACTEIPQNVNPVQNFQLGKYLGTWYEIARLDHSFERGMDNISATYSMREDGGVKVINRGYKKEEEHYSQAEGKAYFVEDANKGFLKVSFFGPFYGSYIVIDTDYENYTMISGPDYSYFWILARKPQLDKTTLDRLIAKAKRIGFDTGKLIYVSHNIKKKS